MRVVSYNILDGGVGRADPIGEILAAQKADVIALIEADDQWVVDRLARRLKMDCIVATGKRHKSAILSHWPIRCSWDHALLLPEVTNTFLLAEVLTPGGQAMPVAAVHLHPHAKLKDEAVRLEEIGAVLKVLAKLDRPHLLMGDFNSTSPIQQIELPRCRPRTQKDWEENGCMLPREVITRVLAAGYLDTLHASRGDAAGQLGTFSTHYPGQRVDYIFASGFPSQRVKDAWIETDRLAEFASDHFPVGVEIA